MIFRFPEKSRNLPTLCFIFDKKCTCNIHVNRKKNRVQNETNGHKRYDFNPELFLLISFEGRWQGLVEFWFLSARYIRWQHYGVISTRVHVMSVSNCKYLKFMKGFKKQTLFIFLLDFFFFLKFLMIYKFTHNFWQGLIFF